MKRIVFMGTPKFSVPILEMLIKEKYHIVLVVTQPDKEVGRKRVLTPSLVKEVALKNNIEVFQASRLRNDYQRILSVNPDLIITAAYGQILPKELLNKVKAINVHGSLLPKYRGGAPIQYSLFEGDQKTGITLMEMDYQMDKGNMIAQETLKISEDDNYTSLSDKLSQLGMKMLRDWLPKILYNDYKAVPQDESLVTFAYNIKREEEFLDFSQPAEKVVNKVRGLTEEPGASFIINNTLFKVFKAKKSDIITSAPPCTVISTRKKLVISCKDSSIEIDVIQQQGKKIMDIKDFLNGTTMIKEGDIAERIKNE